MPTPPGLPPSQRFAQSETNDIPARTQTAVEPETLERSLLGVLRILGSIAIVVGLMIVTACLFLLAGNLPLPGDPSKEFVTTLGLLGFASGVLYLVCGVGAFLRKTWAVYALLVLGYRSVQCRNRNHQRQRPSVDQFLVGFIGGSECPQSFVNPPAIKRGRPISGACSRAAVFHCLKRGRIC